MPRISDTGRVRHRNTRKPPTAALCFRAEQAAALQRLPCTSAYIFGQDSDFVFYSRSSRTPERMPRLLCPPDGLFRRNPRISPTIIASRDGMIGYVDPASDAAQAAEPDGSVNLRRAGHARRHPRRKRGETRSRCSARSSSLDPIRAPFRKPAPGPPNPTAKVVLCKPEFTEPLSATRAGRAYRQADRKR